MYILFISIAIALILSFFILSAFGSKSTNIKIGQKAPMFELIDQDGRIFSLEQYKGKKMVIYFFPKADTPG